MYSYIQAQAYIVLKNITIAIFSIAIKSLSIVIYLKILEDDIKYMLQHILKELGGGEVSSLLQSQFKR